MIKGSLNNRVFFNVEIGSEILYCDKFYCLCNSKVYGSNKHCIRFTNVYEAEQFKEDIFNSSLDSEFTEIYGEVKYIGDDYMELL